MIAATSETLQSWNGIPERERSRSLAASRFVDFRNHPKDNEARRRTCEAIRNGAVLKEFATHWRAFLDRATPADFQFQAELCSRLIVNSSGGVLENGGLCLNRNSGLPFLPGSAVKGVARRYAINELAQIEPSKDKAFLVSQIALVFGWCEDDWKCGRKPNGELFSDFEFACGDGWAEIRLSAIAKILESLRSPASAELPKRMRHFAGCISFFPAYPVGGDPGIDLDVVTCHHPKYYAAGGAEPALDNEEPRPIIFPAISADRHPRFIFAVSAGKSAHQGFAQQALNWLRLGVEIFGIGAKTSAGYGWFQPINPTVAAQEDIKAATAVSDYASELIFKNLVLTRLSRPQEYQLLQQEIPKLAKPENEHWRKLLMDFLAKPEGKDARKRLKDKVWFPKEWLPQ